MIKPSWEKNEGFIKNRLSSRSQLRAKTQESLRCESKKPNPPSPPKNQAKRKSPKSNIQC